MNVDATLMLAIFSTVVMATTPLLLAALGELVVEKSGVLNLGVEGMMLIGAVTAFATAALTGHTALGLLTAMLASMLASLLFAWLTQVLMANQVATGLALTIFGIGVSSLVGAPFVGRTVDILAPVFPDALALHPVLGALFGYPLPVYLSVVLTLLVLVFLNRTRAGLILRAVGESDIAAHSIGYGVLQVRALAIAFGGALAGLGGACYSLMLTPMWADQLTAGRGWIALALVVFSSWRPLRLLMGAYLFGAVATMELHLKAAGISALAPEFLATLPYLATIVALTLISARSSVRSAAPACLGKPFRAST